ncbi:hypothetical protein Peur_046265 [Populus x canadensis]
MVLAWLEADLFPWIVSLRFHDQGNRILSIFLCLKCFSHGTTVSHYSLSSSPSLFLETDLSFPGCFVS